MKTILFGIGLIFLFGSCAGDRYATSQSDAYGNSFKTDNYYSGRDYTYNTIDPNVDRLNLQTEDKLGGLYYGNAEETQSTRLDVLKKDKKIIRTATVYLTTKTPDSISSQLTAIAEKYNGYVKENGSYYSSIRVEAQFLDIALAEVEALGKVESKSISGSDVTSDYLDLQIRLENAQKARTRYLELLSRAENVQAALLVEKELERLNGTIELLEVN